MGCGSSAAAADAAKPNAPAAKKQAPANSGPAPTSSKTGRVKKKEEKDMNDWKIWNALDLKDEAERVRLATFLKQLYEVAESESGKQQQQQQAADLAEPAAMDVNAVVVEREYIGIKLPSPLTLASVQDLVQTYTQDNPPVLHKKYCLIVMKEAYEIIRHQPNVSRVAQPSATHKVTVVGDLHGSIVDLAKIFEINGWPSPQHSYIFNGDFVDRGEFGMEVLMSLLALKAVYPTSVYLNRGNHEDVDIATQYGFRDEVKRKYSDTTGSMFEVICRVFASIPLCCVVEHTAFVVHGGLFRDPSVTLDAINAIDRHQMLTTLAPLRSVGEVATEAMLKAEIVEDMVWSDPDPEEKGRRPNSMRSAGIFYGNDVVCDFLRTLGVKHLVRSHECIQAGYESWECGEGCEVWTVFSASYYSGGNNMAAVLVWEDGNCGRPVPKDYSTENNLCEDLRQRNLMTLVDLIVQHKHLLLLKFRELEGRPDEHLVTPEQWATVMKEVLELDIDWMSLQGTFSEGSIDDGNIAFEVFLDKYRVGISDYKANKASLEANSLSQQLYRNHKQLKAIFSFLDTDHSGKVDRAEFMKGCELLNKVDAERMVDGADLFKMIDIDDSGEIDFNELCECFRLNGLQ